MSDSKFCNYCKTNKTLDSFRIGKGATCKKCEQLKKTIWKNNNKDKVKKEKQRYYLKHKTRLQEKANTYKETSRLELGDYYVIEQLIKRTSLNHQDILEHPDLIKAKRFQLKIHRQLNN